jgi:Type III flagellar switch regulator (C-ring) FliN C-term
VNSDFKLYGKTELEGIGEVVTNVIESWSRKWFGKTSAIIATAHDLNYMKSDNSKPFVKQKMCLVDDVKTNILYFENTEKELSYGLSAGLDEGVTELSAMSSVLIDECLADFIYYIFGKEHSIDCQSVEDKKINISKNSGDVLIELSGDISLYVTLPYIQVKNIASSKLSSIKHIGGALDRRENCVNNGRIKLTLSAGTTELNFGVVSNIRVGDVIRLDSKISDPLSVSTIDGDHVCKAYLGKKEKNIAARIILS